MDERNEDYDIYGSFACVYDKFMDNVPYKEWGKYLKSLLEEQGISDGLMLELGCGTGSLTEILADAGYVVASMYYRSSAEAHMPSQIIDVKTAIRFLRAHADEYEIDPDRIGIIGRSAGGHLSALAAMNSDLYESEEWSGYSSKVQACCDMFGPVDFLKLIEIDEHEIATNPNFRWKSMAETHEGALMGGDPATLRERSKEFCPPYILTKEMCPMLILHGDCDKLVPCSISEEFYDKIVEAGMEDRADLYILAGAGHGTKEFFQPETKEIICAFFDKNLK